MGDAAVVTGLSPKEGTPGTQVTIRGENLGINQADVIGLIICGVDCLMSTRWESSRKLVVRVGLAKPGVGDVIVTTRSGGRGTCTVQFRVFTIQIGPLEESAVWVDESRSIPGLQRDSAAAVTTNFIEDNPLGITDECSDKRAQNGALTELFPEGSGNLRLENFVPVWYMLMHHQGASFDKLRTGLENLRRHGSAVKEGPIVFLKTNLNASISCVDALAALQDKLLKDRETNGWPLTKILYEQIVNCRNGGDTIFNEVLGRKERADSTRNALSVLLRFKFLFFLPENIERNITKGAYAAALNDYTRAKSLFADTDIPLFKEAFNEVEKKMNQFRITLKNKLLELPSALEEQKNIIRYLLMLEPDADVGWDCLIANHRYLENQLWETQQKYVQTEQSSSNYLDADEKLEIPHRFIFVDSICNVLTTKLQQFLKLSQAYVSGQLSATANLRKDGEVEQMVRGMVQLASWLLGNAILPETLSADVRKRYESRLARWSVNNKDDTMYLLQSLKTLRSTVSSLLQQELLGKHIEPLYELCILLRIKCLGRVMEQARQGIYELQHRENWRVQTSEKGCSKTLLPDQFESLTNEIIPIAKQILICGGYPGEIDLFTIEKWRLSILQNFELLVVSFKETLERLVGITPSSAAAIDTRRPSALALGNAPDVKSKDGGPRKDRKLLIVLGNCDYALRFSLPTLVDRFRQAGLRYSEHVLERGRATYAAFRNLLLKRYIDAKCGTFSELIEPVRYDQVAVVKDVSNYIKDLLLCIVSVQAELFLVAAHFTPQVMSFTVRHCWDQLIEHAKAFSRGILSATVATQIYLDLSAFEVSTSNFTTSETKSFIAEAKSSFEKLSHKPTVDEKQQSFENKMKLTILSLQPPSIAAT